jgi:hypothetical protein
MGSNNMSKRYHMTANEARDKKSSHPEAAFVLVTPALAEYWLNRNTKNRNPSADTVDRYRRVIGADDWMPTCQGIGFDTSSVLVDGQQRLMAIASGSTSVVLLVVWGLDPNVIAVIDEQRKRTAGNLFQIYGEDNATRRAAVARGIYEIGAAFNGRPTNKEVFDTLEKHRAAIDWITKIQSTGSAGLDRKLAGDIQAALAVAWEKNPKPIDSMVRQVWNAEGLSKSSPAWVLLRYLRVLQSDEKSHVKLDSDVDRLQKVLRVCYAAVKGEDNLQHLKTSAVANDYYLQNRRALLP